MRKFPLLNEGASGTIMEISMAIYSLMFARGSDLNTPTVIWVNRQFT